MARGTPTALALGPGYLHSAPLGTTEPTDLTTPWASVSASWINLGYCVDIDTEILTRRGWLTHDQVQDGDECLGLSAADGLARWQPILKMNRFGAPPQGREMVAMSNRVHSSVTTPNHRWLVDRRPTDAPHLVTGSRGRKQGRVITTTETMLWADHIPVAAPVVNLPVEPKYEDAFIELLAWYVTEGSCNGQGQVAIYQSLSANAENCASIRATLTALFGPARDSLRSPRHVVPPAWREGVNKTCAVFYLNKAASDAVIAAAPGKVIPFALINSLTISQLHLLLDTAIKGDGWHGHFLSQRERTRLEPFQMAATLTGQFTTLRDIPNRGRPNWVLNIMEKTKDIPARRRMKRLHHVSHDLIWCPTTPDGTWLARRDGTVFYTHNTDEGSEFRYSPDTDTVEVAEELDPVQVVTTGRASSVRFALAEITATHLKLATNGGTITTGTGIVTFEPPDLGAEVRIMLGFESEDHTERWIYRQCFQTGDVSIVRRKGADKATIDTEFSLEKPATGARLYKAIFASPLRA